MFSRTRTARSDHMLHLKNWLRLLPVLMVMGGIFFLSHQPGKTLHLPDIANIDKLLHGFAYMVLGIAYLLALPPQWHHRFPWIVGCSVVVFCLFYGISDEVHQSFIPGRFVSGMDVVADGIGGVVAPGVFWRWRRWREKNRGRVML